MCKAFKADLNYIVQRRNSRLSLNPRKTLTILIWIFWSLRMLILKYVWHKIWIIGGIMYFLAVVHGMPSLSSLINNTMYVMNSAGVLLILMHATIQVVYCHYILTPFTKFLILTPLLILKQEDKSIQWKIKCQAMVLRIKVLQYNTFLFRYQLLILWEKLYLCA